MRQINISPESDSAEAGEVGYELERKGDFFLNREEREWIERRRQYCRVRDEKARKVGA